MLYCSYSITSTVKQQTMLWAGWRKCDVMWWELLWLNALKNTLMRRRVDVLKVKLIRATISESYITITCHFISADSEPSVLLTQSLFVWHTHWVSGVLERNSLLYWMSFNVFLSKLVSYQLMSGYWKTKWTENDIPTSHSFLWSHKKLIFKQTFCKIDKVPLRKYCSFEAQNLWWPCWQSCLLHLLANLKIVKDVNHRRT